MSSMQFHVSLRRMCVLQLLDEVGCDPLYPVIEVLLGSTMSLLIFCLLYLSTCKRRVLNSPTMRVDSSISPCNSIISCLMQFDTLLFRSAHLKDCLFSCLWQPRILFLIARHVVLPKRHCCSLNFNNVVVSFRGRRRVLQSCDQVSVSQ